MFHYLFTFYFDLSSLSGNAMSLDHQHYGGYFLSKEFYSQNNEAKK